MATKKKGEGGSRLTDEIRQLIANLHLGRMGECFDEEVTRAEEEGTPFPELFARLLRAQYHFRQESALAWRIRRAALPEQWTLESFPYKLQPGISQRQIRSFAELDFVGRAENIVFIGPTEPATCCRISLSI